ncbi:hypothetical protein [Actinorugispora endophytica]|uniref:Uncharacterized protein n=1 Tax=Actinorugispora endophytica TaxID=1605990 RepID=A0A4R6V546_9ACTN|nr:hypothetical protein [Actinorugispora endophytica]TDQ55434.1 hypothetical protein EV190_101761 [Actinorugispora endophytica]
MVQLPAVEAAVDAEFLAIVEGFGDRTPAGAPATAKLRPTRHEPDPEQQPAPAPAPEEEAPAPAEKDGADKPAA